MDAGEILAWMRAGRAELDKGAAVSRLCSDLMVAAVPACSRHCPGVWGLETPGSWRESLRGTIRDSD